MNQLAKYKQIRTWKQQVEHSAPRQGETAPDFSLTELDSTSTIRLSDYRGKKPVALIFGRHT